MLRLLACRQRFAFRQDSGDDTKFTPGANPMTEANKLDEPLSDTDYDELEVFLGSNAVPQDCMDLEMLDGFLTAIVSGPELIQPSEWLPVVWSDSQRTVTPVFQNNEQAERILSLVLRMLCCSRRTSESIRSACSLFWNTGVTVR